MCCARCLLMEKKICGATILVDISALQEKAGMCDQPFVL